MTAVLSAILLGVGLGLTVLVLGGPGWAALGFGFMQFNFYALIHMATYNDRGGS